MMVRDMVRTKKPAYQEMGLDGADEDTCCARDGRVS